MFKKVCAYNHISNKGDKSMTEHDLEVTTLHQEVAQMKAKICQLENSVEFLQKEIQIVTQISVQEIVAAVLLTQDSAKQSKPDEEEKTLEDQEQSVKCDICKFKVRGEWSMIKHMSNEHDKFISCDICGTYFRTNHSLAIHTGKEHKLITAGEGSSDEANDCNNHLCKQCPQKFRIINELKWHMEESHDTKVSKKTKSR